MYCLYIILLSSPFATLNLMTVREIYFFLILCFECPPAEEASMRSFNISRFLPSLPPPLNQQSNAWQEGRTKLMKRQVCDWYKLGFLLSVPLEKKAGINVCPVKLRQWFSTLYEAQMFSSSLSCGFSFSSAYKLLQLEMIKYVKTFCCLLFLSRESSNYYFCY